MSGSAKNQVRSFLFVSSSNLGDAVLSLPAFAAALSAFPGAEADVVCGPAAKAVFEDDPRIREVMVDVKRPLSSRLKLLKKVHAARYDRVIDLRGSLYTFLAKRPGAFWAGSASHARDRHLNKVQAIGMNVEPFRFGPTRSMDPGALTGRTAVIAPGSKSSTKEWMPERFASLATRLIQEDALDVVWIGDERERPLIDQIRALMGEPSANLAGRISWKETVELIRGAAIVITNDSAPLHAADHIGKKTIAIFGPTSPDRYGPQRSAAGIVYKGIACSPCGDAQCRFGHRRCLSEISVEDVYRKTRALLEDEPERETPRVLVVRLDRIGDVTLSFPAVAAIRSKYPNARITWLVRPPAAELAARCPDSDEVIEYSYAKGGAHHTLAGWRGLAAQLRRRRFDMAFILHPTVRAHVLAAVSGIPYRAGIAAKGAWFLTHRVADLRPQGYQHESRYAQDVVRALGVPQSDALPKLLLYQEDYSRAADLLRAAGADPDRPYVVLHAGSSSVSKCWPREYFEELARRLSESQGYQIVWTGDASTRTVNAWLAEQVKGSFDLTASTSIASLGALCDKAKAVITNDSGPAHIAAASGAAVVSIFGRKEKGLSERRWKPLGHSVITLQKDVGCATCLADRCTIGFECLKALSPEEVYDAVLRVAALRSKEDGQQSAVIGHARKS